ncbi:MAG: hypothetical protein M1834_000912 [Cirrosporium novae-zelandiae]|nr:MAG: hypothetical protein M1834_000912 [Cirrosporium novae-zelandiae]
MVKSEGNRCTRNCLNCPICTAPLGVNSLGKEGPGDAPRGPWVLGCQYCMWTTLDIGIKFEKPTNIYGQLLKIRNGGVKKDDHDHHKEIAEEEIEDDGVDDGDEEKEEQDLKKEIPSNDQSQDPDDRFKTLKSFYKSQISTTTTGSPFFGSPLDQSFSSPSALSRIMSLYTSLGSSSLSKKPKSKPPVMREAANPGEGLFVHSADAEKNTVEALRKSGGTSLLSTHDQRLTQTYPSNARFVQDLRPVPALLRTKRSKRCRECRHILVKPEYKVQTTRFRIRLIAMNYIPSISIRSLHSSRTDLNALQPGHPTQLLLVLKNPLFDPVKVTLATPAITTGPRQSKVTILCPQFEVGANTDVWDEALRAGDSKRQSRVAGSVDANGEKQAEAGKVWESGRNWTSIVVEIVPGMKKIVDSVKDQELEEGEGEDEDILEIPVFVRMEYDAEGAPGETGEKSAEGKRELTYWCVLGVGRIAGG